MHLLPSTYLLTQTPLIFISLPSMHHSQRVTMCQRSQVKDGLTGCCLLHYHHGSTVEQKGVTYFLRQLKSGLIPASWHLWVPWRPHS